jgi:hypothetical protein
MFTGTMTETEMRHEHPLELENLLAGGPREKGTEAARRLRVRIFWPLCVLVTLALAYGLFWFVTFEETALPIKASSAASRTGS